MSRYSPPKKTAAQKRHWKNTPHIDAPLTDKDIKRREEQDKRWRAIIEKDQAAKSTRNWDE